MAKPMTIGTATSSTAPIVSATKLEQLDQLVDGMSVTLSPEEIASLEAPYVPHKVIGID